MIALTDTATVKVAELIGAEDEAGLALRVAVRPGGCSGFSYEMFFDSEFADDDKVQEYGDVRLVCDPSSAEMLDGATLDYTESIQETGFKINNPNAERTCGCGSSFS
ncbi:MAG: iron-sulfur cluster assembly accessory protein [Verrucomicrobiales bacterium]|jgi:iron-sulfur cluster assembly accessory protein